MHNGVIENYDLIKHSNLDHIHFISDTDTEVIVQLVEKYVEQGMYVEEAFRHSLKRLHGSYAIGLIDAQDSDTLYAAKNRSPLLVGLGDGFNVIASDAIAVLQITNQFLELKDQEVVDYIFDLVIKDYEKKMISSPLMNEFEKAISLRVIDSNWVEHMSAMEHLKE